MQSFGITSVVGAMAMISNLCIAENNVRMDMTRLSSSTTGFEDKYSSLVTASQEFTRTPSVTTSTSGVGAFLSGVGSTMLDDVYSAAGIFSQEDSSDEVVDEIEKQIRLQQNKFGD